MSFTDTEWGPPVFRKNVVLNTFEIISYGNVTRKFATGFQTIDQVGAWVRSQGGEMGTIKEHPFLGRYRECSIPATHYRPIVIDD